MILVEVREHLVRESELGLDCCLDIHFLVRVVVVVKCLIKMRRISWLNVAFNMLHASKDE